MFGIGFMEVIVIAIVAGVMLFGISFFIRLLRGDTDRDN